MTTERKPNIHLVGAGGAGFWTALSLVRSVDDPSRIVVYDDDDLQGGLGHSRLPVATPTTKKVDLLRGFIRVAMGDTPPTMRDVRFTGDEPVAGDWVIDASDMATNVRAEVWKKARALGARCLRVSYDGADSTIVIAEGIPLETAGEQGGIGYRNVPSLALSLAAGGIAAECIKRMLAEPCQHVEMQVSLSEWVRPIAKAA